MRRPHTSPGLAAALMATLLALALAGCAVHPGAATSASSATSADAATTTTAASPDCALDPALFWNTSRLTFDYETYATAEELAELSDVVIRGTVDRVQEGRASASGVVSWIVVVTDPEVISGALADDNDTVYVEIEGFGTQELVFAPGTEIVAYLNLAPASGGDMVNLTDMVDPAAGRPEGYELYTWVSRWQGVVLQRPGCSDVFWPYTGVVAPGELADALTGRTFFADAPTLAPDVRDDVAFELCRTVGVAAAAPADPTVSANVAAYYSTTDASLRWWVSAGYPPSTTIFAPPVGSDIAAVCYIRPGSDSSVLRVLVGSDGLATAGAVVPELSDESRFLARPPLR
ncbi:MAG TPA: hypothetical protein VGP24_07275 [Glaciihabitans sp.]|nr:hypothetical protein [Glaciihabitans sp.]